MKSRDFKVKCVNCNKCFLGKTSKSALNRHRVWCDSRVLFLKKYNIDPNILSSLYNKFGSVLGFMKEYPYWNNHTQYYKLFKYYNIVVSVKKSSNNEIVKELRRKTFLENSGFAHNFSKNHPSRIKWEKRLLTEEGITNVFQRESVKRKSIKTIVEKYGKELWLYSITKRGNGIISKLNKQIFSILETNNIKFNIEFKVLRENGYYYAYDIILDNNKIIEVYGDYWHGNPQIYKKSDILLKGSSKEMLVEDKWKYDNKKIQFIKDKGYSVLVIWEKDIKDDLESVTNTILNYAKN